MNEKFLIPISILIAGLLIGLGLFWNKEPEKIPVKDETTTGDFRFKKQGISIVDPKIDHIQGNPEKAKLFIVEYADLECPGCKIYHNEVLKPLLKKYSKDEVAFVFRQFPFDKSYGGEKPLHPNSGEEARAAECAAKQGGDKKFFEFIDKIFSETRSDGNFPLHRLPLIAEEIKLNKEKFVDCLKDPKIKDKVEASFQEAIHAGLENTPSIFVQVKDSGRNFETVIEYNILDKIISEFLQK